MTNRINETIQIHCINSFRRGAILGMFMKNKLGMLDSNAKMDDEWMIISTLQESSNFYISTAKEPMAVFPRIYIKQDIFDSLILLADVEKQIPFLFSLVK